MWGRGKCHPQSLIQTDSTLWRLTSSFSHNFHSITTNNMSFASKEKDVVPEQQNILKVRITLTSTKVKQLEKVCADLINRAKGSELAVKGPVRLPTKVLTVTTRKTPNGEGSKTWDRYEMRIHKRVIDLYAPTDVVKKVTSYNIEAGVDIVITVAQ